MCWLNKDICILKPLSAGAVTSQNITVSNHDENVSAISQTAIQLVSDYTGSREQAAPGALNL